ncbi:MAG: ABC transporter substrate-binding protein [Trebonia sp.]
MRTTPLRIVAVLGAAAACAAALAGCGSTSSSTASSSTGASPSGSAAASAVGAPSATATTFPMTVTAENGAVAIKAKPSRIISLSPTATEDLYAVGAGGQVVAVDQDSNYPAAAPRTSLSGLTPNIEAIAKYNPSLVVASENTGGLVSGLAKLGVPVLIEPAVATLGAAYAQIQQVGQATGHAAQAVSVTTSMKRQILAAVDKAGPHQGTTYYWEVSANPFYSATSATIMGQLAGLFGLKDIADQADKPADGGYPELTQEYIVAARPQVIFLADNQPSDGGQTPAIVAHRPGWSDIPAVQHHAVIGLNDDIASRWGPRLPQLVTEIAQGIEQAAAAQPSTSPAP